MRGPLGTSLPATASGPERQVFLMGGGTVLSGVPQGSVLGPRLFIIFINDLDESAVAADIIKKFADDTKLSQDVSLPASGEALQSSRDGLVRWSDTWGDAI